MKVSIKDITSHADRTEKTAGSLELQSIEYLGSEFSINHAEPFDVCLSMIGLGKLHITFDTTVNLSGPCDRCLTDVTFDVPVSCDETFAIEDGQIVTDEEIGPYPFYEDDEIDIDELFIEEILVNFPAKILCQDDCKGLCPVCGKNRNLVSCGCDDTVLDPRMAQFLDVFNSFKEV